MKLRITKSQGRFTVEREVTWLFFFKSWVPWSVVTRDNWSGSNRTTIHFATAEEAESYINNRIADENKLLDFNSMYVVKELEVEDEIST